jgi:hypothetical protein
MRNIGNIDYLEICAIKIGIDAENRWIICPNRYSILQMNLASKIVFLRKTVLQSKFICKNSRVVFL